MGRGLSRLINLRKTASGYEINSTIPSGGFGLFRDTVMHLVLARLVNSLGLALFILLLLASEIGAQDALRLDSSELRRQLHRKETRRNAEETQRLLNAHRTTHVELFKSYS